MFRTRSLAYLLVVAAIVCACLVSITSEQAARVSVAHSGCSSDFAVGSVGGVNSSLLALTPLQLAVQAAMCALFAAELGTATLLSFGHNRAAGQAKVRPHTLTPPVWAHHMLGLVGCVFLVRKRQSQAVMSCADGCGAELLGGMMVRLLLDVSTDLPGTLRVVFGLHSLLAAKMERITFWSMFLGIRVVWYHAVLIQTCWTVANAHVVQGSGERLLCGSWLMLIALLLWLLLSIVYHANWVRHSCRTVRSKEPCD